MELKKLKEERDSMLLTELILSNSKNIGYNPNLLKLDPSFLKSIFGNKGKVQSLSTVLDTLTY